MRSAVSLALVTSLIGSALPVAAQQHTPMAGPIAPSITREATRFATVEQSKSVDSEWSRARKLAPGTELIVIVKGSPPSNRSFVTGERRALTARKEGALSRPHP